MRRSFWVAKGVKMLVVIAVIIGVLGFVTMNLWNWLVPALFGGPMLSYLQALGLLLLARLLFGGLHPHRRSHFGPWGHRGWQHWRERWEQMTPEEQALFKSRFRGRWQQHWGHGDEQPPGGGPTT